MGLEYAMAFHAWLGKCSSVCETASLPVPSHARVSFDPAQKAKHLLNEK